LSSNSPRPKISEGHVNSRPRLGTRPDRARDISKEERVRLTEELAKRHTPSATALKLLLMTGTRRGEVIGMKWADINFGSAAEPKTLWRRLAPDQKNKKDHTVPLNTGAAHLLVTIRDETLARDGQLGEFIFPSDTKSRHIADIRKAWLTILKNAQIEDLHINRFINNPTFARRIEEKASERRSGFSLEFFSSCAWTKRPCF
jgi:integrase